MTEIQSNAFTNNPLLLDITIPRSVTTISNTAFNYYDDITIYGVAGTYAETYAGTLGATFVAQEVPAETVQLNKTELTLNRNKTETLIVTIAPDNFTDTVVWKSSNTDVATVTADGKVTAVAVGTATIRVTVGKKSASCKVTVLQPVTSISLNKSSLTMSTNDTFALAATVNPSNANNKSVAWSSSDETVATVTQEGLVTAVGKGTATITVTAQDGSSVSRSCTVNVTRCNYICNSVEEMESAHDYEINCTDSWTYTKTGAGELRVTFDAATMLEDEFDFLYIYDGEGTLIGEYTGAVLSGATITVPGDTVVIQLDTDEAGCEWGFKVTEITSDIDTEPPADTSLNGVALGADNLWAYYVNGVVDTTFTGLAENESGKWYIENGYLNWDYTELFSWTDGWYYVMGGRVPTEYTGLVRNSEGLWYVVGGKIDQSFTGLVSSVEGWFYVMDGRVTEEYTGLVTNDAGMWYVAGGKLDDTYTNLVSSEEGWFYVMNGRVTSEFTGLVTNDEGTWYIKNGMLDWNHRGVEGDATGWWYVHDGRVAYEFVGLAENANGIWYVENGKVGFDYTGLACREDGWWYVFESQVLLTYTGLATNENGTWYIQNGFLDFGFSGTVTIGGTEYTVVGGQVQ